MNTMMGLPNPTDAARRLHVKTWKDLQNKRHQTRINWSNSRYRGEAGNGYTFWQFDYRKDNGRLLASRMVAEMQPGERTEPAYWFGEQKPRRLDIHSGIGEIVLGLPERDTALVLPLDASINQYIYLPDKSFYCFRATLGRLVVSGLYPADTDGAGLEVEVHPGDTAVMAPGDEIVPVPAAFIDQITR